MQGYSVCVSANGPQGTTAVFPVTEWRIKGDHLIPVYENGTIPSDESPFSTVTLFQMDDSPIEPCPVTVRTDGMNAALICSRTDGHDGPHSMVAF